jgi:hypothetical protein
MSLLPLVPSSDSHAFEPPHLWQIRIDAAFRDPARRMSCVARVIALMPSIIAGLLRHRQCRRRGVAPSGSTHYTHAPTNGPATVLHSICPLTEFPGIRMVRC